jgi:subtilisin family serine protease
MRSCPRSCAVFALCLAVLLITGVGAYGRADMHRHANISHYTPGLYGTATLISFSNGIVFDTRNGEPALPDELKIAQYEGEGYYLVQVSIPITASVKNQITASNARICGYIPFYALIIHASHTSLRRVGELPFVRWTGIFQPAYKLAPELLNANGTGRIIIQLFPDADCQRAAHKLQEIGYHIDLISDHRLIKRIDATGSVDIIHQVARIPEVLWIQPWAQPEPCNDDAQWVVQTGWRSSTPGPEGWRIWNEGIRGKGLVLSTSDSGIRTDHIVYNDPLNPITAPGEFPNHRKIVAYKLSAGATFGDNAYNGYHGSHVNCTVAGDDSANGGTQPYDGVSKDARLYFYDLGDDYGSFHVDMPTLCDDIYQGGGLGYHILQHSGSWGWTNSTGRYLVFDAAVDAHVWQHRDFLNLYAAGNEYSATTIRNPGIAKNVLTIGATGNGNSSNTIANFSSRGPTQDNRIKPTIMAPGVNLYSADGSGTTGYKTMSGTSMATPATNGAVGLIRHYLLAGFYPTGSENPADSIKYMSCALLRAMPIVSADPNVSSYTIPNFNTGWGRIDVDSVLFFTGDTRKLLICDDTIGVNTGQYTTDTFTVHSQIPLRVSMAWSDTAAAPNANPTIVNDLNLELHAPDGTVYNGNQYSAGQSTPNPGTYDNINVEECCRINTPQIGNWRIVVSGQQVVYGPQPFAYAITGDISAYVGINEGNQDVLPSKYARFDFRLVSTLSRGKVSLEFMLPGTEQLEVTLHDLSGRTRMNFFSGELQPGRSLIERNCSLPSGVYFVLVKTPRTQVIRKFTILK